MQGIGKSVIFVEMERMNRIVSVLLMALIGCVTVFQCHHHDACGNAFFLTYGNEDVAIGLQHGDCHGHDGCAAHGDEAPDCGMHLDEAMMMKSAAPHMENICAWCLLAVDRSFDFSMPEFPGDVVLWEYEADGVTVGYSHVSRLRGPPFV